jgi:hypothetical protein
VAQDAPISGWEHFQAGLRRYDIWKRESGKTMSELGDFLTEMEYVQFEIVDSG